MSRTDLSHSVPLSHPVPTATRPEDNTLFVALELSRKVWLIATSAPAEAKISKRTVAAGDGPGLLALLKGVREQAERRLGRPVRVMVIQEVGLDGFAALPYGSGCTACSRPTALSATLWIPPRSRSTGASGGARLMGLMSRRCCAR